MADFDELIPEANAPFLPTEPEEQKKERIKEESKSRAAVPKLKEIVELLDKDIALFNSVGSIHVDPTTKAEEFLAAWNIQQEKLNYARQIKEYIEQMIPDNQR